MSKDGTNYALIENTVQFTLQYANECFNMTNEAMLETSDTITTPVAFKIGLVCEIGTQNVNNKTIYQHGIFSIRVVQSTAADKTTQYGIGLCENNTVRKMITFKPSDLSFKYFIYADSSSNLFVSGNNANAGSSGSYGSGQNNKIYINESSTQGVGNAKIKLYELLVYHNTSATRENMESYFTSRWGLTTYTDNFNIPPIPPITFSWNNTQYGYGNRSSRINVTTNMNFVGGYGMNYFVLGLHHNTGSAMYINYPQVYSGWIKFQLQTPQVIRGVRWFQTNQSYIGSRIFHFEGSNNDSTWTRIANNLEFGNGSGYGGNGTNGTNVGLGYIPETDELPTGQAKYYQRRFDDSNLFEVNTAYTYYRLLAVSGSGDNSGYETAFNFLVGTVA